MESLVSAAAWDGNDHRQAHGGTAASTTVEPRPNVGLPFVGDRVVDRPRVAAAIVERLGRSSLLHVLAPPGSGKTTALVQAAHRLDVPVAWLTLEDWDSNPGMLVEDLIAALTAAVPGLHRSLVATQRKGADPVQIAATAGSLASNHDLVLVVDDAHLIEHSPEATAALGALIRYREPGLRVVLGARRLLDLKRLGTGATDSDSVVGPALLAADLLEAESILAGLGSSADPGEALAATEGWVAGLFLGLQAEPDRPRSGASGDIDPLALYLKSEILEEMSTDARDLLVRCSAFDRLDESRARGLGFADPRALLVEISSSGIPATWPRDRAWMRLHPRVRELLLAELESHPETDVRTVWFSAGAVLAGEGQIERAIDAFTRAGATEEAGRLLPDVILEIVRRPDIELAGRLLAQASLPEPEPPQVVLARLLVASFHADADAGLAVVGRLVQHGQLAHVIEEQPTAGTLAAGFYAARGFLDDAIAVVDLIPPGRAADAARLWLSLARDDRAAPFPPLAGDDLDAIIARSIYSRGKLRLLELDSDSAWIASTGIDQLIRQWQPMPDDRPRTVPFLAAEIERAIDASDLTAAAAALEELGRIGPAWQPLYEAQVAVRLVRDPGRARSALAGLDRAFESIAFFQELADTWLGAALLLEGDDATALDVLRAAVASMRRGDRVLELPAALVYLAEAEWRAGNEDIADEVMDEAHAAAKDNGLMLRLLRAVKDFPGALSRRIDAEAAPDGPWHALGRMLAAVNDLGTVSSAVPAARLIEFGDPHLAVHGARVRPKIRKSLELLSYLLSRPERTATIDEILTALWSGRDDDSTRAYVRQAVRHLREVLPDGVCVVRDGTALRVEGPILAEAAELEATVAGAARETGLERLNLLLEAVAMGERGEFHAGSRDVPWIDDRRERIRGVLTDVRLDAAELMLERDRHLDALEILRDLLAGDPLLERGWRIRMRALSLLGDRDGVLDTYRRCAAALATIGFEPSRQTKELVARLRS